VCDVRADAAARVEGAIKPYPKGRDAVAPGLGGDPPARNLPLRVLLADR